MRPQHIFVFFISLWLGVSTSQVRAQVEETIAVTDTISQPQYYGLRVGADISKLLRTALSDDYSGFEIVGDFRITKRHYIAAELGTEERTIDLPNLNNTTSGSYIKAGFNYNAYNNWLGMNNLIYAGVRGGFSTFSQTLNSYTIYTTDPLFGDNTIAETREFKGLNASWLELQLGLQAEIFNNLYIGLTVQIKSRITESNPDDYDNLYIPGFGKTTDDSRFGVGYNYTVSYLIPIFKK